MKIYTYTLFIFLFISTNLLWGQNDWNLTKAKKLVSNAQKVAAEGKWDDAIRMLDDTLVNLNNEDLAPYKSYLLFSKAYLYQKRPSLADSSISNLELAQNTYIDALRSQPEDVRILNNLIWVSNKLGDRTSAENYAQRALQLDPGNATNWHLVLGDIYQQDGQLDAAWKAYDQALQKTPTSREAAKRLLTLYQNYTYQKLKGLLEKSREFNENGMPELAVEGLELLMTYQCHQNSRIEEEVLLHWAGIIAANDWVNPRLVERIDAMNCDFEPLNALKSLLGRRNFDISGWWGDYDRRTFYYLAIQESWANYLLSTGEKREALELYRYCKENVVFIFDHSTEIYGKAHFLEIKIWTQIARLYADPELESTPRDFEMLEREVFSGKGKAYKRGDLESIQKFHTVLGMIYVDRERWGGLFSQNAEFQLEHALSTAAKRVEENPKAYVPLPHLHKYLGDTYKALGKIENAGNAYLDAAVGYLETDNLNLCQEMMQEVGGVENQIGNREFKNKKRAVNTILNTRLSVRGLGENAFNAESESYFGKNRANGWLENSEAVGSIDPAIVERQRFKVYADLAKAAEKQGAFNESRKLKSQASNGLSEISVLSSQEDFIRIKQMGMSDKGFRN